MKEAILYGPRDLRIEDLSLPVDDLQDHQVWIQTEVSALKSRNRSRQLRRGGASFREPRTIPAGWAKK